MMKRHRLMVYFTIYLLLGTAAVVSVQGQSPEPPQDDRRPVETISEDSLDVVVPRGRPAAISDWALAGIVWSDACLVRKLADQQSPAANSSANARRNAAILNRAENLINSLEAFGWRRISLAAEASDGSSPMRRQGRNGLAGPPKEISVEPRDVGGASLVPVEGPIDLDLNQKNYRLEGAGDAEPEILPPQVEKGMEEAIASTGTLRPVEFDDDGGRISYRESQTRSDSMPYSFESIYDTDDYDPDVDFRNEKPLVIADPISRAERERLGYEERNEFGSDVADMYGFDDPAEPEDGLIDSNALRIKPSNMLDRLAGVTEIQRYSDQSGRHEEDADWVQLHLNLNQLLWQRVTTTGELDTAMELAQLKLANSVELARSVTNNDRLRSVLNDVD